MPPVAQEAETPQAQAVVAEEAIVPGAVKVAAAGQRAGATEHWVSERVRVRVRVKKGTVETDRPYRRWVGRVWLTPPTNAAK